MGVIVNSLRDSVSCADAEERKNKSEDAEDNGGVDAVCSCIGPVLADNADLRERRTGVRVDGAWNAADDSGFADSGIQAEGGQEEFDSSGGPEIGGGAGFSFVNDFDRINKICQD